MARDCLCAGELQDGAVQETPSAVPPGLCLSLLPQQQGPAPESSEAQIQVISMSKRQAWGRVGRPWQV